MYLSAVLSLMIACSALEPHADMDPSIPEWAGRGLTDGDLTITRHKSKPAGFWAC
jgi:hypothetical protein